MKQMATSRSKVSRKVKKSWSRGCRFYPLVNTLLSLICKRKRRVLKIRHCCLYLIVRRKSFLKLFKWWPMFRTSIIFRRLIPETRQYSWNEKSMQEKNKKPKRLFGSENVKLEFLKAFTSSHMIGFWDQCFKFSGRTSSLSSSRTALAKCLISRLVVSPTIFLCSMYWLTNRI